VYRVLSEWCTERELVEGEALATGVDNPGPRRLGEPERAHLNRRHLVDPLVVGYGANDHSDQVVLHSRSPKKMSPRFSLASGIKTGRRDGRGSTLPFMNLTRRRIESGGRLVLLMNRRFRITALKLLLVRRTRKR
jgi:hypothetical protein